MKSINMCTMLQKNEFLKVIQSIKILDIKPIISYEHEIKENKQNDNFDFQLDSDDNKHTKSIDKEHHSQENVEEQHNRNSEQFNDKVFDNDNNFEYQEDNYSDAQDVDHKHLNEPDEDNVSHHQESFQNDSFPNISNHIKDLDNPLVGSNYELNKSPLNVEELHDKQER